MSTNDDPRSILRDELLDMIQQLGEFRCKSLDSMESVSMDPATMARMVEELDFIALSVCSNYNPNADLRSIDTAPRCRVIFDTSDIKVYRSYRGQPQEELGTFEYADPHLITQLFRALEDAGLKGICRAEHHNGPQSGKRSQVWKQLARFCHRRPGES